MYFIFIWNLYPKMTECQKLVYILIFDMIIPTSICIWRSKYLFVALIWKFDLSIEIYFIKFRTCFRWCGFHILQRTFSFLTSIHATSRAFDLRSFKIEFTIHYFKKNMLHIILLFLFSLLPSLSLLFL